MLLCRENEFSVDEVMWNLDQDRPTCMITAKKKKSTLAMCLECTDTCYRCKYFLPNLHKKKEVGIGFLHITVFPLEADPNPCTFGNQASIFLYVFSKH